jgi:hypothetical protein
MVRFNGCWTCIILTGILFNQWLLLLIMEFTIDSSESNFIHGVSLVLDGDDYLFDVFETCLSKGIDVFVETKRHDYYDCRSDL